MSGQAHIIDIDNIVLIGADLRNLDRMSALIEAEVRRALEGTELGTPQGLANNETRVAGEVARTVVRSLQGGPGGV